MTADLHIIENELWLHTGAGIFYNVICLLFVLAAGYPALHGVQTMVTDENFAQTWYVFWILPVIFIGLNLFMIPKYRGTLYTGRVLQCYIVLSLVLLIILLMFYAMFLIMAVSLNRNAKLQQENHFLSLQQERYENLCMAIEEARQARHDIRHHFVRLSTLAEQGDIEKIKEYLSAATGKISDYNLHLLILSIRALESAFYLYSSLNRDAYKCQFLFGSVRVSCNRIKFSRFISSVKKEGHCKMQQPSKFSTILLIQLPKLFHTLIQNISHLINVFFCDHKRRYDSQYITAC